MRKVITYGTYDLLHQGHINLLRRAKELGDYLIVGVTSDSFDRGRGKLNVRNNVLERVEAVKATGYADEVIIEDYLGQKIDDIQKYDVDIFAIGSDWIGKFDYLNEYCKVVYLPRTEGISSTMLREEKQTNYRIGIVGSGRIANRFVPESKVVNGAQVTAVMNPDKELAEVFAKRHGLTAYTDYDVFLKDVDLVYVASPHLTHYDYVKKALLSDKHVLCEIPYVLSKEQALELYRLA
jgi:glycerol-3-phosphate cytidylyltransferase